MDSLTVNNYRARVVVDIVRTLDGVEEAKWTEARYIESIIWRFCCDQADNQEKKVMMPIDIYRRWVFDNPEFENAHEVIAIAMQFN